MTASHWRRRAQPIIAAILADTTGKTEAEVRRALRDAYPFGPREHHPYKMWCAEVRAQLAVQCIEHEDCRARPDMAQECALSRAPKMPSRKLSEKDAAQLEWLRRNA